VERRRRGHDFLANHERALEPALSSSVDLVVHGGDVFHRSRVPRSLVFQAFRTLKRVAESGVPVFVVPGNHERSRIPHHDLASHPNLHMFRGPETLTMKVRGQRVAVIGFPYERRRVRERFGAILRASDWEREPADIRLLCMHHCVEGATVGPSDYTFRNAPDVVRCSDLPTHFAAVLSGHIHRHQVLHHDLLGRQLSTPVLYPGSVERTAFAEKDEEKGYLLIEAAAGGEGGKLLGYRFVDLPTRPMVAQELAPLGGVEGTWTKGALLDIIRETVAEAPPDAVLRVVIRGKVPAGVGPELEAGRVRALAPPEMNLELLVDGERDNRRVRARRAQTKRPRARTGTDAQGQLSVLEPLSTPSP
jgi:DNA repair exonuclease SbcCD nuclease subunit